MSTVAPAEKPRGAQLPGGQRAIRLAEGVGGRPAVGLGACAAAREFHKPNITYWLGGNSTLEEQWKPIPAWV